MFIKCLFSLIDCLGDVLTIGTINIQDNKDNSKKKTETPLQHNKNVCKHCVSLPVSVETTLRKLKMIHEENGVRLNRRTNKTSLTFSWDMHPTTNGQILSIDETVVENTIAANKSFQKFIFGLRTKSSNDDKLPPIVGKKVRNSVQSGRLALQEYDVKENTFHIRNLDSQKNQLIDHRDLKGTYIREATCDTLFKPNHKVKQQLSTNLDHKFNDPTLITKLYSSMSSLRLNNRQEWAANDHARHHIRRQQQWIKSEQVQKSPISRFKKQTYPNSTSSGQKSDAISGNSDEIIHTTPASIEADQVIDVEYEEERKEAIEKCLKWMNNLPEKFSGLHLLDPATS